MRRLWGSLSFRWSLMALLVLLIPVVLGVSVGLLLSWRFEQIRTTLPASVQTKLHQLEQTSQQTSYAFSEYATHYGGGILNSDIPVLIFILVCIALGIGLALLVSLPVTRLLGRTSSAARRFALGDYSARVKLEQKSRFGSDEVYLLASEFNSMASALEQEQLERRAFIAAIAHEVRTPLTVLRARLETLQDGTPLEAEDTAQMLVQTNRLSRLMTDLGTLSMADSGQLSLNLMNVELVSLCEEMIDAFESKASEKHIRLQLETSQPEIEMHADPDRLAQVIGNLLENAIRHTPETGTVRLKLEPTSLTVVDSGAGFPKTSLELGNEGIQRVLERFYRADGSRNRSLGGSGLGLAIAHAIMKLHAGQLHASNDSNGGVVRLTWDARVLPKMVEKHQKSSRNQKSLELET
jgi:two-component system, OmpR family, sensor histidine kinase BaeS